MTLTVDIPLRMRKRGGRKLMLAPAGTEHLGTAPCARRQRYCKGARAGVPLARMLENGTRATIAELAAAEKINASYVGRVLRLTLLAPDLIETIWMVDSRRTCSLRVY